MALSATFVADFSGFVTAVEKAETKLVDLSAGADRVGGRLNAMVDSFSGKKLVQDALVMVEAVERVGGTSKLTAAELERVGAKAQEAAAKLTAMGQDVPPGLQKIADGVKQVGTASSGTQSLLSGLANQLAGMFTIGAVIAFGRELLSAGDTIVKMSDQTGIGTAAIQKLQYIAGQSASDIGTLIGAIQNMQLRLGDDESGAAGALHKLNLNFDAFRKLDAYSQLTTVAAGIKAIQDPTEQAMLAAALFGKTWKEILPAIKSGMKETGDQAVIMGDDTVRSLDRIGDTLTGARQAATSWGGSLVLLFEKAGFAVGDFLSQFNPEHFGKATSTILAMQAALNDPTGLAGAMSKIPPIALAVGGGVKDLTLKGQQLADVYGDLEVKQLKSVEAAKLEKATLERQNDLFADEYELLTKLQVSIGAKDKALENDIERTKKQTGASMAEYDAMVKLNAAWGLDAHGAIMLQKTALDVLNEKMKELHERKQAGISQAAQEQVLIDEYTKSLYDEAGGLGAVGNTAAVASVAIAGVAASASEALQEVKTNSFEALREATDKWNVLKGTFQLDTSAMLNPADKNVSVYDAAGKIVSKWDYELALKNAGNTSHAPGSVVSGPGNSQVAYDSYQMPYIYTPGVNLPSRDFGGPVSAGQPYYVGKGAQPELFVPSSAGTMHPAGSGGTIITNHIYVTQPLGTPDAIARAVGDAVMTMLRGQGMRLPVGV